MTTPSIAIITTTKNDEKNLLSTLASIHIQSYTAWRHYVKDAGSTDKTLSLLDSNGVKLTSLSGADSGVYDALNIITKQIEEEWAIVIQAGDRFASSTVLAEVAPFLTADVDIVYGDVINIHQFGVQQTKKAKPEEQLWRGMIGSHQAMFIRTALLKKYPYDLKYPIAADFDFLWKCKNDQARFLKIEKTIAIVDGQGLASKKIVQNFSEKRAIVKKHTHNVVYDTYWATQIARVSATSYIKKLAPIAGIVGKLIRRK